MNIPEEFGHYLLLKKLAEDALGETFRAGRVGRDGVDQVVLLRVFNGKGLNLERIGTAVTNGAGVQAALKSPNIGNGVDLGLVRNYPYTAYDYISGKSLARLLAKARSQHTPIPTDHALLIAERLSLALSAAYESRVKDERILHGFVVPELVMVSNEGETRMLGFEVGAALRDCAAGGWRDDSIAPYIAPEVVAGAPPAKQDDVFALGSILYELLTGERLPAGGGGYDALIDGAVLASEGTPIPAPVAALLKKSLVPRDQRITDALGWHKALAKLMIDGHFSPTTFNLAFFMHSLFREDIERENQELQAEKKIDLQKVAPAAKAAAVPVAAAAARPAAAPVREATLAGAAVAPMAASAKGSGGGKGGLFAGLAALVLLVGGGAAWYFLMGPGKGAPAPAVPAPAPALNSDLAAPPLGATSDAAGAAKATPEEIQAQIQQMFEARSKEMEAKLKDQYDQRIKQLQTQLDDSRRPPSEPAPRPVIPAPAPPVEEPKPVQKAEPAPAPPPVSAPAPAPVETRPAVPALAPVQERRQPQTQVGDLVRLGETGVVNARLLSKVDPPYPPSAQKLNRAAQIDIKVLVDERGQVIDSAQIGTKAGFGFDEAALGAARRAVFQPATKDGVRVKIWYTMRLTFKPRI